MYNEILYAFQYCLECSLGVHIFFSSDPSLAKHCKWKVRAGISLRITILFVENAHLTVGFISFSPFVFFSKWVNISKDNNSLQLIFLPILFM